MPTSAKQARSASFVLAYELETVRCNRERELDRIELAVRSLCPEQTRNGDLRRLPEPKLALCVFWAAGRTPAGQWHSSALLRQGSSLGQAMNQPVSQSASVTHHLGAIIGLFTLVAINLACIGSFVLGWW